MKRIIVGFENDTVLVRIQKELRKLGYVDIEFLNKRSKVSVKDAIETEEIFACLLTESIGLEKWTIGEIAGLKDNAHVNIVPIIESSYKGTEGIRLLYTAGITSAILKPEKKGLKASEIAKLLVQPRTLKAARDYYGIAELSDKVSTSRKLTDIEVEQYEKALYDTSYGEPGSDIGDRYYRLALGMTPAQNEYFLTKLSSGILTELTQYEKFYDVLDILSKNGIRMKYRRPAKLKGKKTEILSTVKGTVVTSKGESFEGDNGLLDYEDDDYSFQTEEPVETDSDEEELGFESIERSEVPASDEEPVQSDPLDTDEDFSFEQAEALDNSPEQFVDTYTGAHDTLSYDDDNTVEENDDEDSVDSERNEDMLLLENETSESEFGFIDVHGEQVITDTDIEDALERSVLTSEDAAAIKDMVEKDDAKENEKELLNQKSHTFVFILVGVAVLIVILIVGFIIITVKNKQTRMLAEQANNTKYDVMYQEPQDDGAQFDELSLQEEPLNSVSSNEPEVMPMDDIALFIADKSKPSVSENTPVYVTDKTASNESGGVVKSGPTVSSTLKDTANKVANTVTNTVTSAANSVTNSADKVADTATTVKDKVMTIGEPIEKIDNYTYVPASFSSDYDKASFTEGKTIGGLDLINALNSKSGQDCDVVYKDGTTVHVIAGNAQLTDISIRETYLISKSSLSILTFTQQ